VHRIIYDELVHGIIRPESRTVYLEVIDTLAKQGAEAVILGCTEIELLIKDGMPTSRCWTPPGSTQRPLSTSRSASPIYLQPPNRR
jgi:hypothetical protein